jgi:hypothetical protein
METLLTNMEKDIVNNEEIGGDQKYIVIDNTRDESVKEYTRQRIRELQARFGED